MGMNNMIMIDEEAYILRRAQELAQELANLLMPQLVKQDDYSITNPDGTKSALASFKVFVKEEDGKMCPAMVAFSMGNKEKRELQLNVRFSPEFKDTTCTIDKIQLIGHENGTIQLYQMFE